MQNGLLSHHSDLLAHAVGHYFRSLNLWCVAGGEERRQHTGQQHGTKQPPHQAVAMLGPVVFKQQTATEEEAQVSGCEKDDAVAHHGCAFVIAVSHLRRHREVRYIENCVGRGEEYQHEPGVEDHARLALDVRHVEQGDEGDEADDSAEQQVRPTPSPAGASAITDVAHQGIRHQVIHAGCEDNRACCERGDAQGVGHVVEEVSYQDPDHGRGAMGADGPAELLS
jgi:hypothetical protein